MISDSVKGIGLASLGCVLWGASGIAGQFLLSTKNFSPQQLTDIRLITAGVLLILGNFLYFGKKTLDPWRSSRYAVQLLIFGAVGLLLTQFTYFAAIKYSNAPTATILSYVQPIIMVAWVSLRYHRKPKTREVLCTILAFLGTFLIATDGHPESLAISPKALFYGISCAFAAVVYTVQPKELLMKFPPPIVIGWGMLIGGLAFLPVAEPWNFTGIIDQSSIMAFIFVVIVGTILSFTLYLSSIRYISPVQMTIVASVEPLTSIILAFLLFGLTFTLPEAAGILMILAAVLTIGL